MSGGCSKRLCTLLSNLNYCLASILGCQNDSKSVLQAIRAPEPYVLAKKGASRLGDNF